jgi:hypothetical protein
MQTPFRSPPASLREALRAGPLSALRSQKIGFDPVGPGAKPSTVKTDKITLIALIGFDPVGPAAEPSAIKPDRITLIALITLIRCDSPLYFPFFRPAVSTPRPHRYAKRCGRVRFRQFHFDSP